MDYIILVYVLWLKREGLNLASGAAAVGTFTVRLAGYPGLGSAPDP